MTTASRTAIVIGAGPAGLMAAEVLASAGLAVTVHDQMPSPGRKLLMAGRGGLNLTHSEPPEAFLTRYGEAAPWLAPKVEAFGPADLSGWAEGLGQTLFTGSSGRVFPRAMKASPLLRAWLVRLAGLNVVLRMRSRWLGWNDAGELIFDGPEGKASSRPDVTILAMGGASWPRLGSDGAWAAVLAKAGLSLAPFAPSNVGVRIAWTPAYAGRFAGQPLKAMALTHGDRTVRGEAMISAYGLEGGAVYALSAPIREALATGQPTTITVDLRPDQSVGQLTGRIARPRGSQTVSNHLRKAAGLSPQAIGLIRESTGGPLPEGSGALARLIKGVALTITGTAGLERAISSAGGIATADLDEQMMLRARPGVFAAGEMLDWEAPTGGYLLQACFATGVSAARGALTWLDEPTGG